MDDNLKFTFMVKYIKAGVYHAEYYRLHYFEGQGLVNSTGDDGDLKEDPRHV